MAQSFQVASDLSLGSIYLGYHWVRSSTDTLTFRLLRLNSLTETYNAATVDVLASFSTSSFPDPANHADNVYAMRFDWTGPPLILTATEVYAFEVRGSGTNPTAPIGMIRYTTSQSTGGFFLEQDSTGAATTQHLAGDMPLAVTAAVPEPSAFLYGAVVVLPFCAVFFRRNR